MSRQLVDVVKLELYFFNGPKQSIKKTYTLEFIPVERLRLSCPNRRRRLIKSSCSMLAGKCPAKASVYNFVCPDFAEELSGYLVSLHQSDASTYTSVPF